MRLWLISQSENDDYDTYDSAVVAAETEADARVMDPSGGGDEVGWGDRYNSWARDPAYVKVEYLGEATEGTTQNVICASYNAG